VKEEEERKGEERISGREKIARESTGMHLKTHTIAHIHPLLSHMYS